MSLLFALLIIAAPVLFFIVVPGVQFLAATAPPAKKPAPLDERDLLDTDPREWVRQAEQAVERGEGGRTDLIASVMQISAAEYVHRLGSQARHEQRLVDDRRLCDPAPRFACVICGMYDVAHTHDLEAK